ncbi:hypothetical protein [Roseomonas indoligenes]|uniref:Uncharacterized protein n=1 Tax=Roseomonas indoligenes TaxID=2820811 RepID=A0A940MWE3_9PROT|nr:hypothetical protein [Pararoseomonas indoligenes]MBP0492225.1 hypothetical protein [Pararoseomonas indoligenes]
MPDMEPTTPTRADRIRQALDDVLMQLTTKDHRPAEQIAEDIIYRLNEAKSRPLAAGTTSGQGGE